MTSCGLLTRREASEIGQISFNEINKAIEQHVVLPRRESGRPLIPAEEIAFLVLLHEVPLRLPLETKKRIREWLIQLEPRSVGAEFELSTALRISYTKKAAQALSRACEYTELRDKYIESNPNVIGGEPIIRGTRVPVRSLARQIELGESMDIMIEDYPHIPVEAFRAATLWVKAHPRRGRPVPAWRDEDRKQTGLKSDS